MIRPERVRIEPQDSPGDNRLPGLVEHLVFLGSFREVRVRLLGGALVTAVQANDGVGVAARAGLGRLGAPAARGAARAPRGAGARRGRGGSGARGRGSARDLSRRASAVRVLPMADPSRLTDLRGDVAVVTGGADGIGAACAELLAAAGAQVVILDREAPATPPPGAVSLALDVTDEAAVDAAMAEWPSASGGSTCSWRAPASRSAGRPPSSRWPIGRRSSTSI